MPPSSDEEDTTKASDLYDKAQDNLIRKLEKLDADTADAAAEKTIKQLKKTVSVLKAGKENKAA